MSWSVILLNSIKISSKDYYEEADEGYFREVDVQYLKKLHELHNYLPFLPERIKIEKVENLVVNLHDKIDHVIHIGNLKQALSHSLVLKKFHRVFKFNQKKIFLSWWIMQLLEKLWKIWENTKTTLKLKYDEKAKLCYMDIGSFIVYIKTDDIYNDIAEDVETRSDTSNYELNRPLPKGKNKKVIGLMKDELGGAIMTKFNGVRAKTYSNSIDEGNEYKKTKDTKKCIVKWKLKFANYKHGLKAAQLDNEINHLEKKTWDR